MYFHDTHDRRDILFLCFLFFSFLFSGLYVCVYMYSSRKLSKKVVASNGTACNFYLYTWILRNKCEHTVSSAYPYFFFQFAVCTSLFFLSLHFISFSFRWLYVFHCVHFSFLFYFFFFSYFFSKNILCIICDACCNFMFLSSNIFFLSVQNSPAPESLKLLHRFTVLYYFLNHIVTIYNI